MPKEEPKPFDPLIHTGFRVVPDVDADVDFCTVTPLTNLSGPQISLRDLFALSILQGNLAGGEQVLSDWDCQEIYKRADRMLKAREYQE